MIAKHETLPVLQRLHQRQGDIAGRDFEGVLGRSQLMLFRNAVGVRPRTFNGMFGKLMRESGLLQHPSGETRTLYSLRHTYATEELLAGTDIHTLAKQMWSTASHKNNTQIDAVILYR